MCDACGTQGTSTLSQGLVDFHHQLQTSAPNPLQLSSSSLSRVFSEQKREETGGKQTENVIETDCPGEELHELCTRTDEEAGSIVLHVGYDMNEKEKNDRLSGAVCYEDEIILESKQEETNEAAAAAKKTLESNEEISEEDVEIRRLIEERRTTPKEEKQRLKEVSKQFKKCIKDKKKNEKTGRDSKNIPRLQSDFEYPWNQIC